MQSSEALLPDENAADLVKESAVTLLQLNPVEVSTQLMVEDFTIFRQVLTVIVGYSDSTRCHLMQRRFIMK